MYKGIFKFLPRLCSLIWIHVISLIFILRCLNAQPLANGMSAVSVLGQSDFTLGSIARGVTLSIPTSIAVDIATGKVFVADWGNNRVLRYSSTEALQTGSSAEAVFGQPDMFSNSINNGGLSANTLFTPRSVAVDNLGNLYVADAGNNRVLRYANAANVITGVNTFATAVFGQPNMTSSSANNGGVSASSLSFPTSVAIDALGNLYVADGANNRVLRYSNAATAVANTPAITVFGQSNMFSNAVNSGGLSASTLNRPLGVAIDRLGNIYVADSFNNRVLRYSNATTATNGISASAVFGQPDMVSNVINNGGLSASTLNSPNGLITDSFGNLYVADQGNSRVLRYVNSATAVTGASTSATIVFGQPNMFANIPNNGGINASTLNNPRGVAIDGSRNLYIVDTDNSRVLRYANVTSANTGASATSVMGQFVFVNGSSNMISPERLNSPSFIAIDQTTGKVFVSDANNHRVLRYTSVQALRTGGSAEAVFGQPDMFSNIANNGGVSAYTLNNPQGLAIDGVGNLYVADNFNHRILRYTNAVTAISGAGASAVFGQPDMISRVANNGGRSASSLNQPQGIVTDMAGNLYVADNLNHRILRYSNAATSATGISTIASAVFGQPDMTSGVGNNGGRSSNTLNGPRDVRTDQIGNLYVSDWGNNRILRYANVATAVTGVSTSATMVFGQPNMTLGTAGRSANTLNSPFGIEIDGLGNLYVGDSNNNRVVVYANVATAVVSSSASMAIAVIGQLDMLSGTANNGGRSASTLNQPQGVAIDRVGNLYVADNANNRVLRYVISTPSSVNLPIQDSHVIYPNPVSEEIQIRFSTKRTEDTKVSMVNMLGQTMMVQIAPRASEVLTLNIGRLPSGTYRVVIQDSRGIATQQLVVLR